MSSGWTAADSHIVQKMLKALRKGVRGVKAGIAEHDQLVASAYAEQVGVYRHESGRRGEISLR